MDFVAEVVGEPAVPIAAGVQVLGERCLEADGPVTFSGVADAIARNAHGGDQLAGPGNGAPRAPGAMRSISLPSLSSTTARPMESYAQVLDGQGPGPM